MKTRLEVEIRRGGESISDVMFPIMEKDLKPSLEPKEWSCAAAVSLWLHSPECALETEDARNMQGFSVRGRLSLRLLESRECCYFFKLFSKF